MVLWKDLNCVDNRSIKGSIKKSKLPERSILEANSEKITLETIVGILNSKMGQYLLNEIRGTKNKDINPDYLKEIIIPTNYEIFEKISDSVIKLMNNTSEISNESIEFKQWFKRTYNVPELPQKIEDYYNLTFNEFIKELLKKNKKFKNRSLQNEIKSEYNNSIRKINNLNESNMKLIELIEEKVYELYDLTDKEIKIIEENI